jgi:hypothetical protein
VCGDDGGRCWIGDGRRWFTLFHGYSTVSRNKLTSLLTLRPTDHGHMQLFLFLIFISFSLSFPFPLPPAKMRRFSDGTHFHSCASFFSPSVFSIIIFFDTIVTKGSEKNPIIHHIHNIQTRTVPENELQ